MSMGQSPEREVTSRTKGDEIAALVMARFGKLQKKRKPAVRDGGVREWTTLGGLVVEREGEMRCVCLATGVKCLPQSKVRVANGNGIHDWHAEVLALRAFNNFLLTECRALAADPAYDSFVLQRATGPQPFEMKDVRLYLYASEAPCGDASMELTMSAQEDPTPWTTPLSSATSDAPSLPGRENFAQLGIVRRKPSRPDAPPSLSKSCSDKLTLRQATSLLSSLSSLLISPRRAYLAAIVVPGSSFVPTAFSRCFGRTASVRDELERGGYGYGEMEFLTTSLDFEFSRGDGTGVAPCNVSAVWTPSLDEGLVGGVLQGKKAFQERGASAVSRRRMWRLAREVAGLLADDRWAAVGDALGKGSYGEVKEGELLRERRKAKSIAIEGALKGWLSNMGDEDFGLDPS